MASTSTTPNVPSTGSPTSCTCKHESNIHYLVRCGCPNDRPASHPMHINDDAFHRVWCDGCHKYCYKDAGCPNDLPTTRMVRSGIHRFIPVHSLFSQTLGQEAFNLPPHPEIPKVIGNEFSERHNIEALQEWDGENNASILIPDLTTTTQ